jgi:hypothetical protein
VLRSAIRLLLFVIAFVPYSPGTGASAPAPVTSQRADSLFRAQAWPATADAYRALVQAEPTNGRYWHRLALAQHSMKHEREAINAWTKAEAIGHNPTVMYNLGMANALVGDKDQAFHWLDAAAAAGFRQEELLKTDPDLASLRSDPRFAETVKKVHAVGHPCETQPESRLFDFWIGDWIVKSQGQQVGTSSIQLILGQCVIFENWTGAQGGTGKSYNIFDKTTGKWTQVWVDDSGQITTFTDGEYKDGAMRFLTQSKAADGSPILGRLSFYNLSQDRVRQWKESSVDAGKTWTTDYDFIYERKS